MLRPLALAALPLCVLMAMTAPQIVQVVYGTAWLPAGEVLRWLALGAALRIFGELCYDYLVVLRRSREILRLQVLSLVVLVPAVTYAAARHGVGGAAAALLVVAGLVTAPLYLRELRRVGVDLGALAGAVRPAVLLAAAVAAATWVLFRWLDGGLLALAVCGLGAAAATAAALWRHRADLSVYRVSAAAADAADAAVPVGAGAPAGAHVRPPAERGV